jgi:general stress protein 26
MVGIIRFMKIDQQEILDYVKSQRVGVLALEMMDGSPHASTVHFAHTEDPLVFYFETYRQYRKAEALYGKKITRASLVIGMNENDMKTFQLDGEAMLLESDEMDIFNKVYLGKFPEKIKKAQEPKFVFFKFIPTWWRFTDWNTPEGKKIITSNGN